MIVGQTGSGKSVCWKILQSAMTRLKRDGEPGYNVVRVREHQSYIIHVLLGSSGGVRRSLLHVQMSRHVGRI